MLSTAAFPTVRSAVVVKKVLSSLGFALIGFGLGLSTR